MRKMLIFVAFIICATNAWEHSFLFPANGSKNTIINDISHALKPILRFDDVLFLIYQDKFEDNLPTNVTNVVVQWNMEKGDCLVQNEYDSHYLNYVILASNENETFEMVNYVRESAFWRRGPKSREDKYYVFISKVSNKSEVFEYFWSNNAIKVLLFEREDRGDRGWEIFGYEPFSPTSRCGQTIDPISATNRTDLVRFKSGEISLEHCKLNISLLDLAFPPEVFYNGSRLFLTLFLFMERAYRLNFTHFSMPTDYQLNPIFSLASITDEIEAGLYDGFIGCPFRDWEHYFSYDGRLEVGEILGFSDSMWLIPKRRQLSNISIVLKIFPTDVLVFCFASTFLVSVVWVVVSKCKKRKRLELLDLVRVTLGVGIQVPESRVHKFVLLCYLLYSQQLIYFFQGDLSSKLITPQYEKLIRTMEQLIDSRYEMAMVDYEREMLREADSPLRERLHAKVAATQPVTGAMDVCVLAKETETVAYRDIRATSTYDADCASYVDVLIDDMAQITALTPVIRSGHPLLTIINRVITLTVENGFLRKYETEFVPFRYDISSRIAPLTLGHFQTAFIVLAAGLASGCFIFLAELLCHE